jgi:hypothetical protein
MARWIAYTSAPTLLDAVLKAYARAEISFERCCRISDSIIQRCDFTDTEIELLERSIKVHINDAEVARMFVLGLQIRNALAIVPGKRGRGNPGVPTIVRQISVRLIKRLRGSGLNISRVGRTAPWGTIPTAFEWVAEFWRKTGISGVTPAAVEKWYSRGSRNTTKTRNRR